MKRDLQWHKYGLIVMQTGDECSRIILSSGAEQISADNRRQTTQMAFVGGWLAEYRGKILSLRERPAEEGTSYGDLKITFEPKQTELSLILANELRQGRKLSFEAVTELSVRPERVLTVFDRLPENPGNVQKKERLSGETAAKRQEKERLSGEIAAKRHELEQLVSSTEQLKTELRREEDRAAQAEEENAGLKSRIQQRQQQVDGLKKEKQELCRQMDALTASQEVLTLDCTKAREQLKELRLCAEENIASFELIAQERDSRPVREMLSEIERELQNVENRLESIIRFRERKNRFIEDAILLQNGTVSIGKTQKNQE